MWTNEDRFEFPGSTRRIVRTTSADLRTHVLHVEEPKTKKSKQSLYETLFIRRVLNDGRIYWFTLPNRRPQQNDLVQPLEVAAFQLGLCSRLVHIHQDFRAISSRALAYFESWIPHSTFRLLTSLVAASPSKSRAEASLTDSYHFSPLQCIRRCLSNSGTITPSAASDQQWVPMAISLARILGSSPLTPQMPRDCFVRGIAIGEFLNGSPAYLEVYSPIVIRKMGNCDAFLKKLVTKACWPEVSSQKLEVLIDHVLSPDGLIGDFRQESLSRLHDEHVMFDSHFQRSHLQVLDAVKDREQCEQILELLIGCALSGEELAKKLRPEVEVRSLLDNTRGKRKDGSKKYTPGSLHELMRLGLVVQSKELGGYYRPDAPPPDQVRRSTKQ